MLYNPVFFAAIRNKPLSFATTTAPAVDINQYLLPASECSSQQASIIAVIQGQSMQTCYYLIRWT